MCNLMLEHYSKVVVVAWVCGVSNVDVELVDVELLWFIVFLCYSIEEYY